MNEWMNSPRTACFCYLQYSRRWNPLALADYLFPQGAGMKRCDDLKCDAGGFFCFKAQNLSLKKNTGKSVIARVSSPPPPKKNHATGWNSNCCDHDTAPLCNGNRLMLHSPLIKLPPEHTSQMGLPCLDKAMPVLRAGRKGSKVPANGSIGIGVQRRKVCSTWATRSAVTVV